MSIITVPEMIKEAVKDQDWFKICIVYEAITGEKLEPPKTEKEVNLATLTIPDYLLSSQPSFEEDVDFFDDEEEDNYVEEDTEAVPYYECMACDYTFEQDKERKACPKCRKRKLPHCTFFLS